MKKNESVTARSWSVDWTNTLFLLGYHLLLFALLPVYLVQNSPSASLIWWTVGLAAACLLAITMGYHRLYAHKTFTTHPVVESILVFFGTLATEGSIFSWSHDHRIHHKHVDTELDPYSAPDGFWHSHLLWMLKKRPEINPRVIHDLVKRPALQFHHDHYAYFMVGANALGVGFLWAVTGDLFGAFVIGTLLRMFVVHHCTWFINSLAHMWGSQPYSTEHTAVNNFILSFLTFGEGYHNYHHTFAGDYRNGVRWYQFDPPKYFIWALSKVGLAKNLKTVNKITIKRNLIAADRHLMVERLQSLNIHFDKEAWITRIEEAAASLTENLNGLKTASDRYQKLKAQKDEEVVILRARIKEVKATVSHEMAEWKKMCHLILESSEAKLAHSIA
jgi:stearoyl-CoA desaturase (Delta-9 desaturase)